LFKKRKLSLKIFDFSIKNPETSFVLISRKPPFFHHTTNFFLLTRGKINEKRKE